MYPYIKIEMLPPRLCHKHVYSICFGDLPLVGMQLIIIIMSLVAYFCNIRLDTHLDDIKSKKL